MEGHDAPFACMINLPDRLDPASLRRFLVKLRFDEMTPDQARAAFRRFFDMARPGALDAFRTSTPIDFALVRRRAAAAPDPAATLTPSAGSTPVQVYVTQSGQYGALHTQVISATASEAPYVLDVLRL